ncbi:expressed unknown protein [Seminavis robusta]|uniref:Uncharacterized protein n=1 Tax=Seminavis robusta TaxID=568900 RepID=A0A9N8ECX0_9STRA|nr:expressed unknown protein [Seminavis robusta]|eukprot:Sro817_g206810.1 n/a (1929) ;mRNA; r:16491-22277
MSQRGYSPRRYGRSEHAPIVIDMVDYGGDDFADDFTYSSSHYSSPRPTTSIHSSPRHSGAGGVIGSHHSPRHAAGARHGSPRHSRQGSPRHSSGGSPHHTSTSNHASPRQPAPSPQPNLSASPSNQSSPRQAVRVHNFAQRRSFMMGGFDRPEEFPHQHPQPQQQDVEPNRVYRVENNEDPPVDYDDYPIDTTLNDGMAENEYRQSPGRSRNFQLLDEVDTRDRPVHSARGRTGGLSRPSTLSKKHHEQLLDDSPIYGSSFGTSSSRLDSRSLMETTSTRHVQGATIPVFNRMKRPEESVFTFDSAPDNDMHTVPGVINRPRSDGGGTVVPPDSTRESMSVAQASEKKVFYFDIDDLSQRLLNSGDQDLSRRLRKKKAKNARSRISRNRARRKSKKSVFNLELDSSATSMLQGNDNTVISTPDLVGASRDSSKGYGRFDSRSATSALYVDTSADIDEFATTKDPNPAAIRSVVSSPTRDESSIPIRRNPSVGSPPAEQQTGTLSPDATMEQDGESITQEKGKSSAVLGAANARESSTRSRRETAKQTSPRHLVANNHEQRQRENPLAEKRSSKNHENSTGSVGGAELKGPSPKQSNRINSPSSTKGAEPEADASTHKINRGPADSEVRVTKVYDDINDRLDHIVKRENDAENRQRAIRAVFEEVQQHVADLRKHKQHGLKGDSEDQREGFVDLVSVADSKPKRTDEGDDQVIKRLNESSDNEDILGKLDKHHGNRGPYRQEFRPKVRSPTIEDMVSPAIAPIAPPSPIAPLIPIAVAVSPTKKPSASSVQPAPLPIKSGSNEVIDVDGQNVVPNLSAIKSQEVMREEVMREGEMNDVGEGDQEVQVIDLEKKGDEKNESMPGTKNGHGHRPSGYLSSDHSCDDEVVVQQQSIDAEDPEGTTDVVYIIEEDDGKSVVHVEDNTMLDPEPDPKIFVTDVEPNDPCDPSDTETLKDETTSTKESRRIEATRTDGPRRDAPHMEIPRKDAFVESPTNHILQDELKSTESRGNEILNCLDDEEDKGPVALGRPDIEQNDHEDRLEPDGSRLEVEDAKEAEHSDGDTFASLEELPSGTRVGAVNSPKSATSPKLEEAVLDDSDTDDGANLDIDREFERVVPLDKDDAPVNYSIKIDETLDRVARQNELEKQEMQQGKKLREEQTKASGRNTPRLERLERQSRDSTPKRSSPNRLSRKDEDDKANALLDNLSNGSLFSSDHEEPPRPRSNTPRADKSNSEKGGNFNPNFVDLEDEDDEEIEITTDNKRNLKKKQSTENGVVSLDYDFNLAISAASKSSSSASDLQEFPMSDQHGDGDGDGDGDNYGSGSSNVSSDISESTSGSVTDSSYDSFISIVETEDESDLEFFDEEGGFAENFMSNLVSSTFGWIEKKQEQLVCGFKSGDFDGPSLLRESMTRQKKSEAEEKSKTSKAMKSLRNAVASKYAREGPALSTTPSASVPASGEKKKSSHGKKTSRRAETALEFVEERHKRGKRAETPPNKKSPSSPGVDGEEQHHRNTEKSRKKSSDTVEKPERLKQHVADSRKKSLVDDRKESDSDMSAQAKVLPVSDEKKKATQKKASGNTQHDETVIATLKTTGTARTASSSKKSETKGSPSKNSRNPTKPSSRSTPSSSQYNFDFLSSEDEENVQDAAVKPSVPDPKRAEKEVKKTKTKKADINEDGRKKKPASTSKPIDGEKAASKNIVVNPVNEHKDSNVSSPSLLVSDQIKGKSKRSSSKQAIKARSKSPSPPRSHGTHDDKAPHISTNEAKGSLSPPRPATRSPSPRRAKSPIPSNGPQPERETGGLVDKSSKRVSSSKVSSTKQSTKATKKASKREKISSSKDSSSKVSQTTASKRTNSTRASRKSRANGRALSPAVERRDESDSDGDSANNMTEEERERARKERRRAAALKRRRKLRERRRAKLEQNLTDDTFG